MLMTNSPKAASEFFEACDGKLIYKPLSPTPVVADAELAAIFTSIVRKEDLLDHERIRITACLFQELVEKAFELRVTIIGDRIFAARLDTESGEIDWRLNYQAIHYSSFELPEAVSEGLRGVLRELGLVFAAVDLIVTPDGRYVFLELNPGGQWVWIQQETNLPMVPAMADLLAQGRNTPNASRISVASVA